MCNDKGLAAEVACTDGYWCDLGDARPRLCDEGTMTQGSNTADKDVKADCKVKGKNDYIKSVVKTGTIADGYESTEPGEAWEIPTTKGQYCQQGKICTGGDSADCTAGKFCDRWQLAAAVDNCDSGYYCEAGATTRRPNDLSRYNGDRCLAGQWCGTGVNAGTNCAEGTFNSGRGLKNANECVDCPKGYICNTAGLTYEVLTTGNTYKCPSGSYCAMKTDGTSVTAQ